ncbi:hypothetical protein Daura_22465 [Dactylosporangium aurantiacum]|nr:TetR family transcriptional regulator [Dactylosporangium aurantiacum]UWZ58683.1 hypothetical protein Daura_22465 [Dactylosporangium aurantiacum]
MTEAFGTVQADNPLTAVHRILEQILAASDDLAGPERLAIMFARPELQAQALQRLIAAQRLIAGWLRRTYPDQLDDTLAHATAGAVVGALVGTVLADVEHGETTHELQQQLHRSIKLLTDGLRSLE